MKAWLSRRAGVYAWIWKGHPDRPMYIGQSVNFWNRIRQHHDIREGGGYAQYDAPEGVDFWYWFALNYHDPECVLQGLDPSSLGVANAQTARNRKLAAASWLRLAFCFAEVDLGKLPAELSLEDVEVQLRADLDGVFEQVIGWSPSQQIAPRCRIIFGGGQRERRGLHLTHEGSIAQLFCNGTR